MRTTLTLDSDVAERLRQETQNGRLSLKKVVNERLRMGFGIRPQPARKPFKVVPHESGFCPGVDIARLNQFVDELEVDEVAARMNRSVK